MNSLRISPALPPICPYPGVCTFELCFICIRIRFLYLNVNFKPGLAHCPVVRTSLINRMQRVGWGGVVSGCWGSKGFAGVGEGGGVCGRGGSVLWERDGGPIP